MAQIAKATKSTAKKVAYVSSWSVMQIIKGRLSVAATSNKVTSAVVTDALSECVSVTTAVFSRLKDLLMKRV